MRVADRYSYIDQYSKSGMSISLCRSKNRRAFQRDVSHSLASKSSSSTFCDRQERTEVGIDPNPFNLASSRTVCLSGASDDTWLDFRRVTACEEHFLLLAAVSSPLSICPSLSSSFSLANEGEGQGRGACSLPLSLFSGSHAAGLGGSFTDRNRFRMDSYTSRRSMPYRRHRWWSTFVFEGSLTPSRALPAPSQPSGWHVDCLQFHRELAGTPNPASYAQNRFAPRIFARHTSAFELDHHHSVLALLGGKAKIQ